MNDSHTQTRHLYEYAVDPQSNTAGAHVLQFVGTQKRVLEIGCGPGSITKILAMHQKCQIVGMEIDADAIKKVEPFCEAVIRADLNDPAWPNLLESRAPFDVVVAADVLEHLYDPWETLKRMTTLIGADGYLVLSLPHVGHAAVVSCLLNGNFQYREWGLLDKTHIRFFGLQNIQDLCAQANLKIIDAKYVIKPPEETEFAESWFKLPGELQRAIKRVSHTNIYQVVIKIVPMHSDGDALTLNALDATVATSHTIAKPLRYRLRERIARHLSPYAINRIRTLLRTFKIKL